MLNLAALKLAAIALSVTLVMGTAVGFRMKSALHDYQTRKLKDAAQRQIVDILEKELEKKQVALTAEVERARLRAIDAKAAEIRFADVKGKLDNAVPLSDACNACRIPNERLRILRAAASRTPAPDKDRGAGQTPNPAKR